MQPSDTIYGHFRENWSKAKDEAERALAAVAKAQGLTFYGELAGQISSITFDPHGYDFHHFLGELSTESDAAGAGMISALVRLKDGDQLPGPGFFTLAKKLGRDTSDCVKCWSEEVQRVHNAAAVRR